MQSVKQVAHHSSRKVKAAVKEIHVECFQAVEGFVVLDYLKNNWRHFFHIPYLPAFHTPGWMLRYIFGPYDSKWIEIFSGDFAAGVTVAATAVPQALSYAQLANLPPINGLYTLVLSSSFYAFFGSSMILAVGPVALVSLLVGELVTNYGITPGSKEAVQLAGEACIAIGMLLTVLSFANCGKFIRFISYPVMSGFTTAAACLIGLSQLKNAFGFPSNTPQVGQDGIEYNWQVMQWYAGYWNHQNHIEYCTSSSGTVSKCKGYERYYRNFYATQISMGCYWPLLVLVLIKAYFPFTKAQRSTIVFKIGNFIASICPLLAIIIAANQTWKIKTHGTQGYYETGLKIVGEITPGVNFIAPVTYGNSFGKLVIDVLPITLIAFIESYSVAHRLALQRNELHILNASQEMFANGIANFMSGISQGYPIAGSFSRSALNAVSGATTPVSKLITMSCVLLVLAFLTEDLYYVPNAALAAIIWVSIFTLIHFSDFWLCWKHSKKDFFVICLTAGITFAFNTSLGIICGIGASVFVYLCDATFNPSNSPKLSAIEDKKEEFNINPVDIKNPLITYIKLEGDLNFLTVGRLVDLVAVQVETGFPNPYGDADVFGKKVYDVVTKTLDKWLLPHRPSAVEVLPLVVILDFQIVRVIDLTALVTLEDIATGVRSKGVKFLIINACEEVAKSLVKFGIENDSSSAKVNIDHFLAQAENINIITTTEIEVAEEEIELVSNENNQEEVEDDQQAEKKVEANNIV